MWEMLRGLCSFQTGFYINCMAEASPNLPSVGSRSLSFSPLLLPLLPLFSLVCQFFFSPLLQIRIKKTHSFSDCLQNKSFLLVRTESLVKASRHSFFFFFAEHLLPEIFRDTAVFSQRTCFFAISRMI